MDPTIQTPVKDEMKANGDYIDPMAALSDDTGAPDVDDDGNPVIDSYVAPTVDTPAPAKSKDDTPVEPSVDDKPNDVVTEDAVDLETDEMVPLFFDVLQEKWGLDIPDDKKPKSIEEFSDFMDQLIDANTKHEYYNEDSQQFDSFLRNGGDPRVFLQATGAKKMVEALDLENEEDCRLGLQMYWEKKGLDPDEIKAEIKKSEKLDTIREDAAEKMPKLKSLVAQEQSQLVENAKLAEQKRQNDINEYNNGLVSAVKSVKSVMGIEFTDNHRRELLPYMTQRDAEGFTPMLRDYYADPYMYNVITAFAYKNKDKILEMMGEPAKDNAIKTFKEKQKEIAAKKRATSTVDPSGDGEDQFLIRARGVEKRD